MTIVSCLSCDVTHLDHVMFGAGTPVVMQTRDRVRPVCTNTSERREVMVGMTKKSQECKVDE